MKKILIIFLSSLFYILCSQPTHAQQAGLSIAPPVAQILLAPNKKFTQAFTITNLGKSGDFVASFHSVKPIGIEGQATIDPALLDLSNVPVIPRLENADIRIGEPFHLDVEQAQQLVVSLEGSSISDTEDTYLALVIQSSPETGAVSQTTPGISALIFTTLTGDNNIPVKLEMRDFTFAPFADSAKPLKIKASLENLSNVMIRPEGKLQILSFQGREIYQTSLYNNLILSRSKRLIQGRSSENQPFSLVWSPKFYSFGPHTIRLTITTVGGSKILEVDRVIWFIPIRILIIFLLAIIICVMLILLKKRYTQR